MGKFTLPETILDDLRICYKGANSMLPIWLGTGVNPGIKVNSNGKESGITNAEGKIFWCVPRPLTAEEISAIKTSVIQERKVIKELKRKEKLTDIAEDNSKSTPTRKPRNDVIDSDESTPNSTGKKTSGGGGKKKPPVETVVLEDDLNVEGLSLDDE